MNKRLLKYTLEQFDYSKLNNKHYTSRKYNQLLLNYYWNETNDEISLVKYSHERLKGNWFKFIQLLNIDTLFKQKYNTKNKNDILNVAYSNKCKECNTLIPYHKQFCSNKCSSLYKSKDNKFKQKLSDSLKKYYKNENPDLLADRYKKISKSVIKHNELNDTSKYANKNINYTSFDNLSNRFPNLIFKFNKTDYYNCKYLPVQCKKCGFNWNITKTTTISRHECSKCKPKNKHKSQTEIFNFIYNNIKCTENDKSLINPLELDILCHSNKFCVEFNGLLPHSSGYSNISYYNRNIDLNYHLNKTEICEEKGYQLFHVFENEFLDKSLYNIWKSIFLNKIGNTNKIYGRKCYIKEISYNTSKEFIEQNHLQGNCNSSVKLGLYYNDELVSVMTFRKHKVYQWEIARFCSKLNTTVVGGASKLLKYFERNYSPSSIISYANRRWSQGNIYEKLGFEFIENTKPNYFYFKINENILYSREVFMKHKLKNKLDIFDENLSETENMFNNGYRKIYDCGNKKYVKIF